MYGSISQRNHGETSCGIHSDHSSIVEISQAEIKKHSDYLKMACGVAG